jgi:hypothetical protein
MKNYHDDIGVCFISERQQRLDTLWSCAMWAWTVLLGIGIGCVLGVWW